MKPPRPPLPDRAAAGTDQPAALSPLRWRLHRVLEGWGLYAESLGKDLGVFTDPYDYFGRLRRTVACDPAGRRHRPARKGWSREQAIKYMLDNSRSADRMSSPKHEIFIAAFHAVAWTLFIGRRLPELFREAGLQRHRRPSARRALPARPHPSYYPSGPWSAAAFEPKIVALGIASEQNLTI